MDCNKKKYCNKKKKKKRQFFCQNRISKPNFRKSFRAEKDVVKKKVLSFQEDGQKRKIVIKVEFTPLSDCKSFSFKKGFIKYILENGESTLS